MTYDSWKTTDPFDNPARDAAWERHVEECTYCENLTLEHHLQVCVECGHEWHEERCEVGRDEGETCNCTESPLLTSSEVHEMQAAHFQEAERGREEAAADLKYDTWREHND